PARPRAARARARPRGRLARDVARPRRGGAVNERRTRTAPAAGDGPVVRGEGLTRVFGAGPTAVRAIDDVHLHVDAGELGVVRGGPGAGKGTRPRVLGGRERPTAGRVRLAGAGLTSMTEDGLLEVRRERRGFVFQSFGLVPVLSAAENVEVPLRLLEVDPD